MIQSMAMEQKRKTEEAKKFGIKKIEMLKLRIDISMFLGHASVSNHGGFVGVDQLSSKRDVNTGFPF